MVEKAIRLLFMLEQKGRKMIPLRDALHHLVNSVMVLVLLDESIL